jgi:hypothetical protein
VINVILQISFTVMHQFPVFWWTFYEGQVRKNVKTCNEYDNDPIKCLLNKKKQE